MEGSSLKMDRLGMSAVTPMLQGEDGASQAGADIMHGKNSHEPGRYMAQPWHGGLF